MLDQEKKDRLIAIKESQLFVLEKAIKLEIQAEAGEYIEDEDFFEDEDQARAARALKMVALQSRALGLLKQAIKQEMALGIVDEPKGDPDLDWPGFDPEVMSRLEHHLAEAEDIYEKLYYDMLPFDSGEAYSGGAYSERSYDPRFEQKIKEVTNGQRTAGSVSSNLSDRWEFTKESLRCPLTFPASVKV